jgi:hypothetical protein
MSSSGILRRVALVRTDVLEELGASIIRVTRIGVSSYRASVASYGYRSYFTDSSQADAGGAEFLRNVGSYKSHTS